MSTHVQQVQQVRHTTVVACPQCSGVRSTTGRQTFFCCSRRWKVTAGVARLRWLVATGRAEGERREIDMGPVIRSDGTPSPTRRRVRSEYDYTGPVPWGFEVK